MKSPLLSTMTSVMGSLSNKKARPAQQELVLGVVIREGLPTLLQERDIKPTDTRLYTSPPQRTWVGLTEDEMDKVRQSVGYNQRMSAGEYAKLVQFVTQAKLKEKNA